MDERCLHTAGHQRREAYNANEDFHGLTRQVIAVSLDDGTSIDPTMIVVERWSSNGSKKPVIGFAAASSMSRFFDIRYVHCLNTAGRFAAGERDVASAFEPDVYGAIFRNVGKRQPSCRDDILCRRGGAVLIHCFTHS